MTCRLSSTVLAEGVVAGTGSFPASFLMITQASIR
jgi:hypothetical protein